MCTFLVRLNMVQLSSSPEPDMSPSPTRHSGRTVEKMGSPKSDSSPRSFTSLQLALSASTTTYPGYETYIEDGLICLKHKIRNIEKKKVGRGTCKFSFCDEVAFHTTHDVFDLQIKLEEYMKRLKNGDKLNQDQLVGSISRTCLYQQ